MAQSEDKYATFLSAFHYLKLTHVSMPNARKAEKCI